MFGMAVGTASLERRRIRGFQPLIGAHTVNTMPLATLEAFGARGQPSRRLPDDVPSGPRVLAQLRGVVSISTA
jgi:transaldolase